MGMLTVTAATPPKEGLGVLAPDLVSIEQQAVIAQQIRQTTEDAKALVFGRDKADLIIRLTPEAWCVAECLDHLTRTTCAFLPSISHAIAEAPRLTKDRYLRTGVLSALFIRILKPPYRIRLTVLPQLVPQMLSSEKAWSCFVDSQSELLALLSSAAGLAIDEVRVKSPVYARISYNLYGAFLMLAAHQTRHVWQIGQILRTLDKQRTPALFKYSA